MIQEMNQSYEDFATKMNVLKQFDKWRKPLAEAKLDDEKKESNENQNQMSDDSSNDDNSKDKNGDSQEQEIAKENGQSNMNRNNSELDDIDIINNDNQGQNN